MSELPILKPLDVIAICGLCGCQLCKDANYLCGHSRCPLAGDEWARLKAGDMAKQQSADYVDAGVGDELAF